MKVLKSLLVVVLFVSCTTADLVNNWKNPDIDTYDATKVLIVGMTSNPEARKLFEDKLKKEYESRDITAVTSYEYFDNEKKTEEDLSAIENRLLTDGFDTILFSKVIGTDSKERLAKSYKDVDRTYRRFKDDYFMYQDIYYNPEYYESYQVYHAETALYCICAGKDRELIWKGYIDVIDPTSVKETVNDYVKLMLFVMEEQKLIATKEEAKANT